MASASLPTSEEINGLSVLVEQYLPPTADASVLVAYRSECAVVSSWIAAELEVRGARVELTSVDHDDEQRLFDLATRLHWTSRSAMHIVLCELDSASFTCCLKQLSKGGHVASITRVLNAIPEVLSMGLRHGPDRLRRLNAGVLDDLQRSTAVRVTKPNGTDLEVQLAPERYHWVSNYGRATTPHAIVNLPAGEVNTFPEAVDGVLVADGALNVNLPVDLDVRLRDHPVIVDVEASRAVRVRCDDRTLQRFIDAVFRTPCADLVGEFGIGTNIGMTEFVAHNSHLNERHPGVHLGFGEHGQPGLVPYDALYHLDLIVSDVEVRTDAGSVIHTSNLEESDVEHPSGTRDEDTEQAV